MELFRTFGTVFKEIDKRIFENRDYQRGQILLIVVLVMVTTLTIGLSVAVRSITNIKTSQDAANSEKAFSAAEAGIEKSLTNGSSTTGTFTNNSKFSTSIITVAGNEFPLNNGSPILKDNAIDIWLSNYPAYTNQWTGSFTLYWGQSSDTCTQSESTNSMSALEVIVLSGSQNNPHMTRYAYDTCSARSLDNNFQYVPPGGGTVAGKSYRYRTTIAVAQGLFVRVVPLYAPALVALQVCGACAQLPAQGTVVQSTGTSDTTQRKIITYRYYPRLPGDILQYSFFIQ